MVWSDGDLAAQDLSEGAELGVEILVVPVRLLEALDEDGSALDVSATWFSSDGVHVVGENPAHVSSLDPGIPVVLHCLLRILDAVEHDEGVVVMLEERPFDANLARANILLEIVTEIQVPCGLWKISDVDHLVGVV